MPPALLIIAGILSFCTFSTAACAEEAEPVWLISNGFHSSLAVRACEVPFRREITGDRSADLLVFGWGDSDYYRHTTSFCTGLRAICCSNGSALHVIPVRGALEARFRHSDVIELALSKRQFASLVAQIEAAFALDASGRRILISRGYFAESRFYAGCERFYFPRMCNVWIAQKLRRSGMPIFVPTAMAASELIWQAKKLGLRRQWLRRPVDAF